MTTQISNARSEGQEVSAVIEDIRRSMRRGNLVRAGSLGLAVGCSAATVMACIAVTMTPIAWYWLPVVAAAIALMGCVVGACLPVSRAAAARVIDSYYMIKDRAITALQFESDPDPKRCSIANRCRWGTGRRFAATSRVSVRRP